MNINIEIRGYETDHGGNLGYPTKVLFFKENL